MKFHKNVNTRNSEKANPLGHEVAGADDHNEADTDDHNEADTDDHKEAGADHHKVADAYDHQAKKKPARGGNDCGKKYKLSCGGDDREWRKQKPTGGGCDW